MDNTNRPRSREKNVTGGSTGVHKRGSGLGTGPVGGGRTSGSSNRGGLGGGSRNTQGGYHGNGGGNRGGGRGSCGLILIAIIVVVVLFGGGKVFSLFGDGSESISQGSYYQTASNTQQSTGGQAETYDWTSLFGGTSSYANETQQSAVSADMTVASGSREKYTEILGNGKDTVTIMIYMCGTDLESKSANASKDMQEIAKASYGDNVNVIVYTGGCKGWKIDGISSSVNQIYQIAGGNLYRLEENMGNKAMTDPATLTEFITYCNNNFPANRNELILWDHGGGSITGYGYDEKQPSAGSMNLTGINKALKNAGVKFDFIGFDACLMACAENALMLNDYADYLVASEETEPGIGWYYTDWLTALGKDTSMDTVTLGKNIVDSFIEECAVKCRGQKTTLSVIDLAEFSNTIPAALKEFSQETADTIVNGNYQEVVNARANAREFAVSSRIDQVDLVDLARRVDVDASGKLVSAIKSAVKYNRTGANMNDAYGVSIYFPNKKPSSVRQAVQINNALGLEDEYTRCIQEFASIQSSGQAVASGSGNAYSAFDILSGGSSYSGASTAVDALQLINMFLGSGSSDYFSGRTISDEDIADYVAANQFDPTYLTWTKGDEGEVIEMPEKQWKLTESVAQNVFYDDGEGYVDMGLDNLYSFDDEGRLMPSTDRTWLAINGQPVAYYYESTIENGEDYSITGIVPALLNGTRVNLVLVFDQDTPYGYIAGAAFVYKDGETETVPKIDVELNEGDTIDFLCDYYTYEGEYSDTYFLGEQMIVTDQMEISNVDLGDGDVLISYKFTDIYNNEYWTPSIVK